MERGRLWEIVNSLDEISGMEINICNNQIRRICFSKSSLSLCPLLHTKCPSTLSRCTKNDRENIEKMKLTGQIVQYTCPFGVEEMLVPIRTMGVDNGFVFCSMGIEEGREDEYVTRTEELTGISREELFDAYASMPHFTKGEIYAYTKIIQIIAKEIGQEGLVTKDAESLGLLIKYYVRDNLSKKITLSDISWHFHLSTVSLTEHFRKEFGITIMEYVNIKRLQTAREMLLDSDKLIKEIALSCGFVDVEYFSRCFKKYYGKTPTDCRRAARTAR